MAQVIESREGSGVAAMLHEVMKHGTSPQQSEELADIYDGMPEDGFNTEYVDGDTSFTIEYPQVVDYRKFKITVEAL